MNKKDENTVEPRIIVSAIIRKDNKLLLTKEILESGNKYWIFPGGGVKFGENLEEAFEKLKSIEV